MIQNIHPVDADFKVFVLRDSHALDEICIESKMRRPFDPSQAKCTHLSGRGIHKKKPALRICYRLVAELTAQSLERRDVRARRIGDLFQVRKVRYGVRQLGYFPDILWKIAEDVRSHIRRGLPNRGDWSRDGERRS